MKKLVIIPAYNEALNIVAVIKDLKENAPDFDYVIINDCSKDNLKEVCNTLEYNIVNLPVNLGIGGGVQTGYKYAQDNNYDIAVQFDGDGQHDAKYIKRLIDYMQDNELDMVIGSRFIDKEGFQSSRSRRCGINFLSGLIQVVTGKKILDVTSGFRAVNKAVIDQFCNYYPKDYPEPESIVDVVKQGKKVGEVGVVMRERQGGESSINFAKSIYYMVKVSLAIIIAGLKRKGDQKWDYNLEV